MSHKSENCSEISSHYDLKLFCHYFREVSHWYQQFSHNFGKSITISRKLCHSGKQATSHLKKFPSIWVTTATGALEESKSPFRTSEGIFGASLTSPTPGVPGKSGGSGDQKSFRNPNPYWSRRKYCSTPPICTAVPLPICIDVPFWLLSLDERETQQKHLPFVLQCASHLYGSTAVLFKKVLGVGVTRKLLRGGFCAVWPPFLKKTRASAGSAIKVPNPLKCS